MVISVLPERALAPLARIFIGWRIKNPLDGPARFFAGWMMMTFVFNN